MCTGDLPVAQMLIKVLHDNVTKRYFSYAGMANAVEKGDVVAEHGTVGGRQLQILKSLRRNGALQAFKHFC